MSSVSGSHIDISSLNSIKNIMNDEETSKRTTPAQNGVTVRKVKVTPHPVVIVRRSQPIHTPLLETPVRVEKPKMSLPIPDLFSLSVSVPPTTVPQPTVQRQQVIVARPPSYSDFQSVQTVYNRIPQYQTQTTLPQPTITVQPSYYTTPTQYQQFQSIQVQPQNSIRSPQITTYQSSPTPQYYQQGTQQSARLPIPHPVVSIPKANQHSLQPPEPKYYSDKHTDSYGIRCVCCEGRNDTNLIQCDLCNFWLHTRCVNVARVAENEPYYCPFCRGQRIRCKCGENNNYSDSIIQCTVCKYWCHKECERLEYGFTPKNFVCSYCDPNKTYEIPFNKIVYKDIDLPNEITVKCADKMSIIEDIIDGRFKEMLVEDLNKSEISLCDTIAKYFHTFAPILFERIHEFWRCFTETFSQLFNVDSDIIVKCIDVLANKLIYNSSNTAIYQSIRGTVISDAIGPNMATISLHKLDNFPDPVSIYTKNNKVYTHDPIDDNQFIVEIPGFLEHYDEVKCDNGIPYSCISITNKDYVIDVSGSTLPYLANLRRSFHFNCIVKMFKVGNDVRVALYSTRQRGPLNDDKCRRGPAIQADGELVLPLDGYIPFNTEKVEWKEKKSRSRVSRSHSESQDLDSIEQSRGDSPPPSPTRDKRRKKKTGKDKKIKVKKEKKYQGEEVKLSLLSAFSSDIVPPMPFIIVDDKEVKAKHEKSSGKRKKNYYD